MAEIILDPQAIQELLQSEQGPVAQWLARTSQAVTNQAKIESPVRTGRLRASITWQLANDSQGLFGIVGSNVEYAGFVHDGTEDQRANPFLQRALDRVLAQS